ncbi:MAG: TadE/TadG family type IV pilus assembly protein [Actinomycetota bacterium]
MLTRNQRTARTSPWAGDAGASAVEFALVLPVLILLVFGIVQFGIAYNRVQGLQAAAREGARLASIGASFTEIQTRARAAQNLFDGLDVSVATTPSTSGSTRPCASAGIGNEVKVTASVSSSSNPEYRISIPLLGSFTPTFSATGSFRCERTGP